MTGSEFETIILHAMDREEAADRCTMGRYGVQVTHFTGASGALETRAIQSLPDFEGLLPPLGRQFIFDAKVCSQSSFNMARYRDDAKGTKVRQFNHLLNRADFGAIAFLLIHWPERQLKRSIDPEQTWAFPVYRSHPFWTRFAMAETTMLRRDDCEEYAVRVHWTIPEGCRKSRPDVLSAILELEETSFPARSTVAGGFHRADASRDDSGVQGDNRPQRAMARPGMRD